MQFSLPASSSLKGSVSLQHPVLTQFRPVTVFSNVLPLHAKLHVSLSFICSSVYSLPRSWSPFSGKHCYNSGALL